MEGIIEVAKIFGFILLIVGFCNIVKISFRSGWSIGKACIVQSKVNRDVYSETDINIESSYKPISKYTRVTYTPELKYEYTVDNIVYSSSRVYSEPMWPLSVNDILPFTDNSMHDVWYKSDKPEFSYLKPSSGLPSVLLVVIGVLLIFVDYIFWQEIINYLTNIFI